MHYIASDHAGYVLKSQLMQNESNLQDLGCTSKDSCHYPEYAQALCEKMKKGDKGVLVCGSGVGVSIVANKCQGIMCAIVQDSYNAKIAAQQGCNVIAIGERVVGEKMAQEIVNVFLETEQEQTDLQAFVADWEDQVYK